jgi:hypothetical protein
MHCFGTVTDLTRGIGRLRRSQPRSFLVELSARQERGLAQTENSPRYLVLLCTCESTYLDFLASVLMRNCTWLRRLFAPVSGTCVHH